MTNSIPMYIPEEEPKRGRYAVWYPNARRKEALRRASEDRLDVTVFHDGVVLEVGNDK